MRSEFEAWAMSVMNPNLERYGDGQYRAPHIEIAWSAWEAALNRAIEVMPGGSVTDPQWVCDKMRELGGTRGG